MPRSEQLIHGPQDHTGDIQRIGFTIDKLLQRADELPGGEHTRKLALTERALKTARETDLQHYVLDCNWRLAEIYAAHNDVRSSGKHLQACCDAAEAGQRHALFESVGFWRTVGRYHFQLGDFLTALEFFRRAETVCTASERRTEVYVLVLNDFGGVYTQIADFPLAIRYFAEARELAETLGDEAAVARTTSNTATVFALLSEWPRAIELYEQALDLRRRIGDMSGQISTLGNLATAYVNQHNWKQALMHIDKAEALQRQYAPHRPNPRLLYVRGQIYTHQRNISKAGPMLRKSLQDFRRVGNTHMAMRVECDIAAFLIANKRPDAALKLLYKAVDIIKRIGDKYQLYQLYFEIARALVEKSDSEAALEYMRLALELKDEMFGSERTRALMRIEAHIIMRRSNADHAVMRRKLDQSHEEIEKLQGQVKQAIASLNSKNRALDKIQREIQQLLRASRPGKKTLLEILAFISSNRDIGQSIQHIDQLLQHSQGEKLSQLAQHCPELSSAELQICSLVLGGMMSKEIAAYLSISPRTVESHRGRIRRKLRLDTGADLMTHLAAV